MVIYNQKLLIGIKGRIQVSTFEKDNKKEYITEVIAEKVTFLSLKKQEEADE